MICSQCNGFGYTVTLLETSKVWCYGCQGAGNVADVHGAWKIYGAEMRGWRTEQELTLRAASIKYGIDPSNLSKMERGILKPRCYYKELK